MFDLMLLAAVDRHADEAALIERIAWLERVKSAAAAGQARAAAALDDKRRADEAAAGVPTAKQGRGLASEVALARRDSPVRGGRHLGLGKALVHEMPYTLAARALAALHWSILSGNHPRVVPIVTSGSGRDGQTCGCAFGLNAAVSIARHIVHKQIPFYRPVPTVCADTCCTARLCLALRSPTRS